METEEETEWIGIIVSDQTTNSEVVSIVDFHLDGTAGVTAEAWETGTHLAEGGRDAVENSIHLVHNQVWISSAFTALATATVK